jgi:hypothetical protein
MNQRIVRLDDAAVYEIDSCFVLAGTTRLLEIGEGVPMGVKNYPQDKMWPPKLRLLLMRFYGTQGDGALSFSAYRNGVLAGELLSVPAGASSGWKNSAMLGLVFGSKDELSIQAVNASSSVSPLLWGECIFFW